MGNGAGSSSDTVWTYTFTPTDADESVTIDVAAGAISDPAGNTNTATPTQFAFTHDATTPTLSNIVMSSNGNTGYAKATQKVILTITASEAVTGLACTIDDESATMGGSGTDWTAELTISGDETPGGCRILLRKLLRRSGQRRIGRYHSQLWLRDHRLHSSHTERVHRSNHANHRHITRRRYQRR